ncbi:hypothetical protein BaRGS_00012629 [Batillaria attramentaria]|uniref:Ataxin-10 n=1 Tax=Batillaria attramentaria TaxID=370345 RepID=A0ABD0L9Y2_9CAEN
MLNFKAASFDLKPLIQEVNNDENGVADIDQFVDTMSYVLAEFGRQISALKDKKTAEDYRVCLTDCFRAMRNCCGVNKVMQHRFGTDMEILNLVRKLMEAVREQCSGMEREQTLAVGVQFLGNATMGNDSMPSQENIWNVFQHQLKPWLVMGSEKLTNHTCFLINNCLLTQTRMFPDFFESTNNVEVLLTVVRMCVAHNMDFGMYMLEVLSSRLMGWERKLSGHSDPPRSHPPAHKSNLIYLCEVVSNGRAIFDKLPDKDAHSDERLCELTKHLEILSRATAFDVFDRMSDQTDFLTCAISLLKKVHEWGKSGNNMLSRLDKASKGAALDVDQRHPGYLLRRDLVRIIGNMSFRNKENQDLVRTVGGIPLILEQAVIDDRNPFITQWTEMAVRNLCEGNLENVKVIKDLKIQGIANPTELLNRFGVTVDVDGERVVVRSAKPSPSPSKAILGRKPSV